jgi:predicted DNA-binding helix-hairpin-helix protein
MTRRARKIEVKFKVDPRIAEALFAAGFTGTTKIRAASRAALLAVPGVGPATVDRLKA